MKKTAIIFFLFLSFFSMKAQLSKAEVEDAIKSVNLKELKDVYVVRTRQHDGSAGWFERFEKLDVKTLDIVFNEHSMTLKGSTYLALLPYEKIKIIFIKNGLHLTIEMQD